MKQIVIGSRGSDLALWQANHVKNQLLELGCVADIKIIKTQGDLIQHLSFDKLEGKGFFTKEIEEALLSKSIDLAVHSHKDLETNPPAGLTIACVSEREDPSDMLLILPSKVDSTNKWNLANKAKVGTSSARRKSQLLAYREDISILDLRGNVPTRIEKLRTGDYDAIVLAKAGVDRLQIDLSEFHVEILDPTEFVPAPAQGALGLQIRDEDTELFDLLQKMNAKQVQQQIRIERLVLNRLDGGCQLPLGVYCTSNDELYVSYAKHATSERVFKTYQVNNPDEIVDQVIADLNAFALES